jgi:glycosyltransferase involved in cell wall biosynthesis
MRLTISMPCFGRPQRTIRAIESICNQTIDGWEALVIGDGCSVMQDYIFSNYFSDLVKTVNARGNNLNISNLTQNYGGHGYHITNLNIQRATGKYFTFMANDDVILPNHFENYLSGIEGTDYDFVFFNSFIEPHGGLRNAELRYGGIGHSEILVKTEFLKQMPPHNADYGHDWVLIDNMMRSSTKGYIKCENKPATYVVKGLGEHRADSID